MIKLILALLIALLALLPSDLDGRECFEDEAVVMMVQTWTGTHHEVARDTGRLYCVAIDDMRVIVNE